MEIKLTSLSDGPVYLQVRQQVESLIKGGELASGDALPSPASLAAKLSVDRGEIQRAYYELEQGGLVQKKTGKDFLGKEKTTYAVK
jgi:GntR family transcriptional regulator